MLRIFREPAAFRPLFGTRTCSSSLYHHPRTGHATRWFSQSSKLYAQPKQYTQEQLSAFQNHYATLGLDNKATDKDIKSAYRSLSKRFHPDMMRNVDSQEYHNHPDRPEFVKIKESYDLLSDPARRGAYDAEYDGIVLAIKRLLEKQRAARGVDPKRTIISHLRLDQPTTLEDGSPMREYCVVQVGGLPPQATLVDFLRAIADISPVGRVIDCRLMPPSKLGVDRAALVEFANDDCAQYFGLLALNNRFHVLGKRVWHSKLVPPLKVYSRPPPPQATRVLVIHGPRDHKLMTVSAVGEFLDQKVAGGKSDGYLVVSSEIEESRTVRDSTNGPNSATIEWVFTTWRRGAKLALEALRREYPELSVTYGQDPCE